MPVLYLTEQGATLRKEGDLLLVTKEGQELLKVPAIKVEQVVVLGKLLNQRTLLMRYRRKSDLPSLDRAIAGLEEALSKLDSANEVSSLHGIEGAASAGYYAASSRVETGNPGGYLLSGHGRC